MKYGYLDFNLTVSSYWDESWNKKALLNIGDAVEYFVVKQLYESLGIDGEDMIPISISQLTSYRGEKLIVALNIALDSYVGYNAILDKLSPDIIPVFLGMSFTEKALTSTQESCLKRHAPVGCRDERSYILLQSHNIPCYLNGCTATIYRNEARPSEKWRNKIVFIDVPYAVKKVIPDTIKDDIVILEQEKYCKRSDFQEGISPTDWAYDVLQVYASKPRLIVTSRFHGAVLCIANDIPCIIALEKYTFRFSWLRNWMPIFTDGDFDKIDWNNAGKRPDYSGLRDVILRVAQARIMQTCFDFMYKDYITAIQVSKDESDEKSCSNQVLYYRKVWEEIQQTWSPDKQYLYGFWGINDNSEKLHALISVTYPNAKMVSVYDMFKSITYQGINSDKPTELSKYKDCESFYVIVTAYLASRVADDIFSMTGFPAERSFLCKRDFIDLDELRKN